MVSLGLGFLTPAPAPAHGAKGGTTVTIPGDYYSPAVLVINAGDTVTFVNKDTDPHVTTSVPGAPEAFTIANAAGKSQFYKFTKPGIYQYYCLTHATYDAKLRRVVAHKDADTFPIAMEGLIVVKGPGLVGASEASLTFADGDLAPNVAVIKAGGKVTWTNDGKDRVLVFHEGGPGKLALPAGKSGTATFAKPGVYLFYDSNAATMDEETELAKAKPGTKVFPVSMQGFVVAL